MESSSPFVQHHEFFDVLLQPFHSKKQPSNHVKEADAGRKTWRRGTSGGKIEANDEFGIEDYKSVSNTGFDRLTDTKLFRHYFQKSNVDHLEKVFSIVRQKLSRLHRDEMLGIDVNVMIFMSATMKAAGHLGQITKEICIQARTQTSSRSKHCSISRRV